MSSYQCHNSVTREAAYRLFFLIMELYLSDYEQYVIFENPWVPLIMAVEKPPQTYYDP